MYFGRLSHFAAPQVAPLARPNRESYFFPHRTRDRQAASRNREDTHASSLLILADPTPLPRLCATQGETSPVVPELAFTEPGSARAARRLLTRRHAERCGSGGRHRLCDCLCR